MFKIPRDFPPAADFIGVGGAAEDLRWHSRTVFRLVAAVWVRRLPTTSKLSVSRRLRWSRWEQRHFLAQLVAYQWHSPSLNAISGKQSLETICLLLAYKIKYPENFFLLRGNHECASINRIYGNFTFESMGKFRLWIFPIGNLLQIFDFSFSWPLQDFMMNASGATMSNCGKLSPTASTACLLLRLLTRRSSAAMEVSVRIYM